MAWHGKWQPSPAVGDGGGWRWQWRCEGRRWSGRTERGVVGGSGEGVGRGWAGSVAVEAAVAGRMAVEMAAAVQVAAQVAAAGSVAVELSAAGTQQYYK